jgi:hypothetical protein
MNTLFAFFFFLATAFAQEPVPAPAVDVPVVEASAPVAAEEPVAVVPAPVVTPPTTDGEAIEAAVSMVEAFKAGQIPFGVGLALTLLVYLVNAVGLQTLVSQKIVPIIAFLVGTAGSIGTGLATGVPVLDAIVTGVLAGVAAVGGWEAIAKVFTSAEPSGVSKG